MKIVEIGGSGLIGSASAVGRIATGSLVSGIVEVWGPEQFRLDELIRRGLACDIHHRGEDSETEMDAENHEDGQRESGL